MSTLAVVEEILWKTGIPMSVRDIVETAGESLPTKSKTPDTVVARDLAMNIKKLGEKSKFVRTSPGRYTMREIHLAKLAESRAAEQESETIIAATKLLESTRRTERSPKSAVIEPQTTADEIIVTTPL